MVTADVIEVLAGANLEQYAQTVGESGRSPIGRVEMVTGMATATRNGAQIILQVGDRVFKQDLIETASNSSCAISFLDGSAFNLSANCRLVLNEMVYDPGGAGNSQLFNLVAGALTFASGQVAKTGEMKVTTPVATMGVRGTICNGEIGEETDPASGLTVAKLLLTSLEHADRTIGRCAAFDPSGNLLAQADQPGVQIVLRVIGGQYSVSQVILSAQQLQLLQGQAAATEQFGMMALQTPIIDLQQGPPGDPQGGAQQPQSGSAVAAGRRARLLTLFPASPTLARHRSLKSRLRLLPASLP